MKTSGLALAACLCLLAACGGSETQNSASPEPQKAEEQILVEPPVFEPVSKIVAGGAVNIEDFAATTVGRRIVGSELLIEESTDYVVVASDRSRTCVGPKQLVPIKDSATYLVEAVIELQDINDDTTPTITAWSYDEDRSPYDKGWSVQYFDSTAAPQGVVVALSAKYATQAGDGVKALAFPDGVAFARFCVGPHSGGGADGETAKYYSVTVTETTLAPS